MEESGTTGMEGQNGDSDGCNGVSGPLLFRDGMVWGSGFRA